MRYLQRVKKPPKVIDMATAERHNRHERRIKRDAHRLREQRQHNSFGVPLAEDDEPREVELRIRPHGEPDILTRLGRIVR